MTDRVRRAFQEDAPEAAALALRLWPDHDKAELEAEFASLLAQEDAAVFLKFSGSTPVGFAQCQLRHDYVEGTCTSPVGYLEGVYVDASFRRRGVSQELLAACEAWAKEQGCREFASDCELENTESLHFHLGSGFREANRIICFTKPLT